MVKYSQFAQFAFSLPVSATGIHIKISAYPYRVFMEIIHRKKLQIQSALTNLNADSLQRMSLDRRYIMQHAKFDQETKRSRKAISTQGMLERQSTQQSLPLIVSLRLHDG